MKWRSRLQQMDLQERGYTQRYLEIRIQILGCFQDAVIKFFQMALFLSISGQSNSQAILPKINEELLKILGVLIGLHKTDLIFNLIALASRLKH